MPSLTSNTTYRRWRLFVALLACVIVTACSTNDARPTAATWAPEWEQRKGLIPDVEALLDGGREYCDQLDGQYRVSLAELLPSPIDVLDEPVSEWSAHAASIVFGCSEDEAVLADQLETLDVLAAEIDAGLAAIDS